MAVFQYVMNSYGTFAVGLHMPAPALRDGSSSVSLLLTGQLLSRSGIRAEHRRSHLPSL